MRQKIGVVIGVMLITAVIAGTAFGWMGCDKEGRNGSHDHKGKMEAIAKELNLTADQEARLKTTKEAHRAQMKELRVALKEKRQALKDELSKSGVTKKEIEPIVADLKKIECDMVDKRVDGIFRIKEVLTPEQFARLQAKKEDGKKNGKMRHGGKEW